MEKGQQEEAAPGAYGSLHRWLSLAVGLLVLVVSGGCGSSAENESIAQSRRSVDRATATALIQSQQALRQGALRAALALADSAAEDAPRLADAHFQRGRVLSELKRFEEAEQAYRKVAELAPDYRGAWYNLGNNAYRQQQYQQAVTFYRKAQAKHPSAATLVSLGWTYVAQGKVDSARYAYEEAIATDSTHAQAYARLGQLYEDEGELGEALGYSQRALELTPDNVNYRYVVGAQLLRLNRPEEAVTHLKAVTEARSWHQGAHYNLGQALMRLGRQEEAAHYLARADSLEAAESDIEQLQSVAQNNPDNPQRWSALGAALEEAGRLNEAREAYSVALYLRPEDPTLRNNLAMLVAELGNHDAAVAHYQALLGQHPNFIEGWFNLGVVYAWNGEPQKAEKAWKRVLRQDPNHQQAKDYLARLSDGSSDGGAR